MHTQFSSHENRLRCGDEPRRVVQPSARLPPQKLSANGMDAIYPREPTGGTWIACNSRGNLLALLNWNILGTAQIAAKPKSRGEVIPLLIDAPDCSSAERRFDSLPLAGTFPFRLVGVFPRRGGDHRMAVGRHSHPNSTTVLEPQPLVFFQYFRPRRRNCARQNLSSCTATPVGRGSGLASDASSRPWPEARGIFNLYAPAGCRDRQLHRGAV